MTHKHWPVKTSDVRGAARLAVDATAGLAALVEAVHARILRTPGLPKVPGLASTASDNRMDERTGERTKGLTGLVYKTIRGVTRLVGGSVDGLLGALASAWPEAGGSREPNAEREALIAALGGVLGDHLAATGNPLAIPMTLRQQGRVLTLNKAALAAQLPDAGSHVAVMIHGLCMNDLQWSTRSGHDHGVALQSELGFTPVYLHYNTGLPIPANGRALADLLEQLVDQWPQSVQRLVLIGHSMGGLVARSAMHHGKLAGHRWLGCVDAAVFLGTPHHGAPLERAGHWIDTLLGATPYAAPFSRLGKLRSAGITDLRHGHLLEGNVHLPLPTAVACYAVAASLGEQRGDVKDRLLGDGLVPLASALGQHPQAARHLAFAPERQFIAWGRGHLDLLGDPAVCAQLVQWLKPPVQ